jgi:hypothetical protein
MHAFLLPRIGPCQVEHVLYFYLSITMGKRCVGSGMVKPEQILGMITCSTVLNNMLAARSMQTETVLLSSASLAIIKSLHPRRMSFTEHFT